MGPTHDEAVVKLWADSLERAVKTHDDTVAKLRDANGRAIWSEEREQEARGAALEALKAKAQEAQAVAERGQEHAGKMRASAGDDMTTWLSPAQLTEASARGPFVREEAETARYHELAERGRAALASGDPVTVWLWARYLGQRVAADRRAAARVTGDAPQVPGAGEVAGVLRELREAALPERIKTAAAAADALEKQAQQLASRARGVVMERDGTLEQARDEMRRTVYSWF